MRENKNFTFSRFPQNATPKVQPFLIGLTKCIKRKIQDEDNPPTLLNVELNQIVVIVSLKSAAESLTKYHDYIDEHNINSKYLNASEKELCKPV